MKINERQLRKLQKQRHFYDIQRMILANPLFKNLPPRDQKTLQRLIYKAEMAEMFIRDRNIIRVNQSFDEIVDQIADMLDQSLAEQDEDFDDDGNRRDRDGDN